MHGKPRSLNLKFDRILVDAPCSGNFASDRDWFNNRTLKDIERNAGLQREILTKAVDCLSDEGEMVYSTCSLEPEEDELNMDWAIKNLNLQTEEIYCHGEKGLTNVFGKQLDPSIKHCRRLWPGETQGFFVCKLKKRSVQAMNPRPITNFASQFGVQIALNLDLMVEKNGRFYLVNPALKPLVTARFLLCWSLFGES